MTRTSVSRKKGFTLTESAIVLAMVGMIVAGVWQVMTSSKQAAASNTLYQQMLITVQNVRDFFSGRAMPTTNADMVTNYTTATMRAARVFPADMCPANCVAGTITTIYNVLGGATTFALPDADSNALPDANQFTLTTAGLTRKACIDLGTKLTTRSAEIGVNSVVVTGTSTTTITTFPASPTTMDTACAPNSSTGALSVTINFKLRSN